MDIKTWKILTIVLTLACVILLVALICSVAVLSRKPEEEDTRKLTLEIHPKTPFIDYRRGDSSTYDHLTEELTSYLDAYKFENLNNNIENILDCDVFRVGLLPESERDKACRFDPAHLGPDCIIQQEYGYYDGLPCVLLNLNKVLNWVPEDFEKGYVPCQINSTYSKGSIAVTCEGETLEDKKNMGTLSYYPSSGFSFHYFPYRNQAGYRSPLVFVRFENPRPLVTISVICKAWGSNINASNFKPAKFKIRYG